MIAIPFDPQSGYGQKMRFAKQRAAKEKPLGDWDVWGDNKLKMIIPGRADRPAGPLQVTTWRFFCF
jgi:hypothetical protein